MISRRDNNKEKYMVIVAGKIDSDVNSNANIISNRNSKSQS